MRLYMHIDIWEKIPYIGIINNDNSKSYYQAEQFYEFIRKLRKDDPDISSDPIQVIISDTNPNRESIKWDTVVLEKYVYARALKHRYVSEIHKGSAIKNVDYYYFTKEVICELLKNGKGSGLIVDQIVHKYQSPDIIASYWVDENPDLDDLECEKMIYRPPFVWQEDMAGYRFYYASDIADKVLSRVAI